MGKAVLVVEEAVSRIKELGDNVPEGKHIVTGDITSRLMKL